MARPDRLTQAQLKEVARRRNMSVRIQPEWGGEIRVTYPLTHYTRVGHTHAEAVALMDRQAAFTNDLEDALATLVTMADARDAAERAYPEEFHAKVARTA